MNTARIRVLQITDPHLFADSGSTLMGVNTSATLDEVLAKIQKDYREPDCLLVTGDLSQDDSAAAYHHLKEKLLKINAPSYWLPGNHDQPHLMAAINPSALQKQIILGNWQIVLLNTQVEGKTHGYLRETELEQLATCLQQEPDKHTLLALHHHPAPINSRWMDQIMLQNPEELARVITGHNTVRGIIHGHVHQARTYQFCDLPVMATPSTCVQFAPESDDFQADTRQPGFRVVGLLPDGQIESSVVRVGDKPMKVDLRSNGY
ncbi:3',5'-cyclic-AMP phosphodiesterase [Endozoicomonas acroporae]|uniref:3',5'-cyclic-AMP phosphodiesterase n=1 Tax=Endozoicomonas acroporae TaxID=1701104 RepID=UPI0013D2650F|nr:3',5'-cyclic-AMP phosphodiesterase [Endozoicomonas acroporae]